MSRARHATRYRRAIRQCANVTVVHCTIAGAHRLCGLSTPRAASFRLKRPSLLHCFRASVLHWCFISCGMNFDFTFHDLLIPFRSHTHLVKPFKIDDPSSVSTFSGLSGKQPFKWFSSLFSRFVPVSLMSLGNVYVISNHLWHRVR